MRPASRCCSRLNLRLDPDDRIALLGRNGNGKTTLARLLAAQLPAMEGAMTASGKLRVGYFTQYQVEELDREDTPLEHMSRLMPKATPGAVRAQLGRFGFSGDKAMMKVAKMSGGERARLALALITRDAPHMLILDEPTNHLDVDAREALVQALNEYTGAVVVVSHDRHMLALTADRLVLVDGGTATEFAGSLDDYTDLILKGDGAPAKDAREGQPQGRAPRRRRSARAQPERCARPRWPPSRTSPGSRRARPRSSAPCSIPPPPRPQDAALAMSELMKRHAEAVAALAAAEARWLEASEAIEQAEAACRTGGSAASAPCSASSFPMRWRWRWPRCARMAAIPPCDPDQFDRDLRRHARHRLHRARPLGGRRLTPRPPRRGVRAQRGRDPLARPHRRASARSWRCSPRASPTRSWRARSASRPTR